jgi:hypothetical protein
MANIMKYLDPMYSASDTRGMSPTRLMEKTIPADLYIRTEAPWRKERKRNMTLLEKRKKKEKWKR